MKPLLTGRLVETLEEPARMRSVTDLKLGRKVVAVALNDGSWGLAYRFSRTAGGEEPYSLEPMALIGKNAAELVSWLTLENTLKRSIGLAAANAIASQLIQTAVCSNCAMRPFNITASDIISAIDWRPDEQAAMIGYFEPIVEKIGKLCALSIYELDTSMAPGLLNSAEAPRGLKHADIALISSTTIINNTIDRLLEAAGSCREVAMLGPSTPLVPGAFAGTPVTLLSGVWNVNLNDLSMIDDDCSMRQLIPFLKKVNIRLN